MVACAVVPLLGGGCASPVDPAARTLLNEPRMSDESVVLDLWFVRLPPDPTAEAAVWSAVDEHEFPRDTRQRLSANGFRVGVCGPQLPAALEEILRNDLTTPDETSHPDVADAGLTQGAEFTPVPATQSRVRHRHLQIRPQAETQVVASDVQEQLTFLVDHDGRITGRTVRQGQALFTLQVEKAASGGMRVELVPEIHHGQAKQKYVAIDGGYGLETSRPHEVFDALRVAAELAAGELLLLSSSADRPGSLGDCFFHGSSPAARRLLLIRLSQSPDYGLFAAADAPPNKK